MEDWIDIIRQRLQKAEAPLPSGDWEAFEASALPVKRPRVLPWVISALAAAAVAAVLLLSKPKEESALEQPLASVERVEPDTLASIAEVLPSDSMFQPSTLSSTPVVRKQTAVSTLPDQVSVEEPVPQNPLAEKDLDATKEAIDEPVVEPSVTQNTNSAEESALKDVFESEQPAGEKSERRFAVSPYIGSTGNLSRPFKEYPVMTAAPDITSPKPAKESSSIRHSLPLSFGLEISYFPASRLALTSGLELSVYNSAFTVPIFGEQRQRVHYLGIPLKADWVVWQAGRFSTWLGAGGKVDRCVRARVNDKAVQDNTLNWSVMADASLQFALTKNLGLYIQPEVSWYFKPADSVLQTYRTEHPLMFTVGAGLRIGF